MKYCNYFKRYLKRRYETSAKQIFEVFCREGYLEIVKWVKQITSETHIKNNNYDPFRSACECGHFEVTIWLRENFSEIKFYVQDNYEFCHACERDHFEVAK